MIIKVYSVFDTKAAVFANPFYMPNDSVALRGFRDAVNSPESLLNKHPEDYSLYRIGEFDDAVGLLKPEVPPAVMVTASSVFVDRRPKEVTPEVLADKTHIAATAAEKRGA